MLWTSGRICFSQFWFLRDEGREKVDECVALRLYLSGTSRKLLDVSGLVGFVPGGNELWFLWFLSLFFGFYYDDGLSRQKGGAKREPQTLKLLSFIMRRGTRVL